MVAGFSPRQRARRATALAALLAAAAVAGGCGGPGGSGSGSAGAPSSGTSRSADTGFAGAALPGGVRAPRLLLDDQDGRAVALGGPSAEVTVVAFVYAGCRACSLIAQQVRGALDRVHAPLQALVVSVRPGEAPSAIARFLRVVGLQGRVRYLVGPAPALQRAWRYYRVTTLQAGRAAFERAAQVVLLDRSGAQRVVYQAEQLTPEGLAADIAKLQGAPTGG